MDKVSKRQPLSMDTVVKLALFVGHELSSQANSITKRGTIYKSGDAVD